jgi:hypothetical protein
MMAAYLNVSDVQKKSTIQFKIIDVWKISDLEISVVTIEIISKQVILGIIFAVHQKLGVATSYMTP